VGQAYSRPAIIPDSGRPDGVQVMARSHATSRVVPIALGLAMLGIIIAAALSPNTGAVPAQGYCQYNQCIAGTSIPWWVVAVIAIVVVAALGAALFLMRRRRPPSGVRPYAGAAGGGAAAGGPAPPGGAAPAQPEYLETAEDVGSAPPVPAGAVAGAGAGAASGAAAKGAQEPDIDSLMAELDKISTEILKRPKTPPEGGGDTGGTS